MFQKILISVYKVKLPLYIKGVHPVSHVSVLCKDKQDLMVDRQYLGHRHVKINGKKKREVEDILDSQQTNKTLEFLVSWKAFGTEQNLDDPRLNHVFFSDLIIKFDSSCLNATSQHQRPRTKIERAYIVTCSL